MRWQISMELEERRVAEQKIEELLLFLFKVAKTKKNKKKKKSKFFILLIEGKEER